MLNIMSTRLSCIDCELTLISAAESVGAYFFACRISLRRMLGKNQYRVVEEGAINGSLNSVYSISHPLI